MSPRFLKSFRPCPTWLVLAGMVVISTGIASAQQRSEKESQLTRPQSVKKAVVSQEWTATERELTLMEIDSVSAAGMRGRRSQTIRNLRAIADSAQTGRSPEIWAAAELAAVRQFLSALAREEEELITLEPIPVLEAVLRVVTEHQWEGLRVDALEMLAECQVAASQDELAAKTLERAASGAQSIGETDRAVRQWLTAARVYRNLGHLAKLRLVWNALDEIFKVDANQLELATLEAMEAERLLCLPSLDKWPMSGTTPAAATLQPTQSQVGILADGSEDGRSRMLLANNTAGSVSGKLKISTAQGGIPRWHVGEKGHVIEILGSATADSAPAEAEKTLILAPWQRLRLFLKCESNQPGTLPVTLSWVSGERELLSVVDFEFATENASEAAFIEESIGQVSGGMPVPVYHHLYYRGEGASVENFLVHSSVRGRVEIYQEETGVLIAVDQEGDGRLDGSNDYLNAAFDRDENSIADFKMSESNAVEDLEIYALPADPDARFAEISLYLAKQADGKAEWNRSAKDSVNYEP